MQGPAGPPGPVGPSPFACLIPAGTNQSALINDCLAAGLAVMLADGEHHLGVPGGAPDPIIFPIFGGSLSGVGPSSELVVDWTRLVGAADDPLNDVIEVLGQKDLASLNTVLTANTMTNTKRMRFAALPAVGERWVAVEGPNTVDESGVTPNALLSFSEMVHISPAWAGANPVELDLPTLQFHSGTAPPQTAQAVIPIEDVYIDNLKIRAPAASNIAVGIRCDYSLNVHLSRIWFEGMSRFGYEFRLGSRGWSAREMTKGEFCNALGGHSSIMQFQESDIRTLGYGAAVHPAGVPRHVLCYRERCTSGLISDAQLSNITGAFRTWGSRELHFRDIIASEWNLDPMRLRDPTLGATGCFDTGAGNFAVDGEFQHNCSWEGCWVNEGETFANDPNVVGANYAWWFNDCQDSNVAGSGVASYGRTPSTAYDGVVYPQIGLVLDDAWGNTFTGFRVANVNYGLITLGGCQSTINDVYFDGNGADTQPIIAMYLNNTSQDGSPRFGRVTFDSWGTKVWFGANFIGAPDYNLEIKEYVNRQSAFSVAAGLVVEGRFTDVVLANNPGAGVLEFDLVNIDPASPAGGRNILPGGAASQYSAVVVNAGPSNAGTGLILVCELPAAEAWSNITAPGGGIKQNDLLEGAGAAGVVNNATVFPNCIGKSRDATAGGGVRCVRVGQA